MSRRLSEERANLAQFVTVRGGTAFANVPVSGDNLGAAADDPVHTVDAVWFATGGAGEAVPWNDADPVGFGRLVAEYPAFLVSTRGYADRTAFGMLVACRELFSRAYPQHQLLRAIALTEKMSRRSIVYLAEGIQVVQPDGSAPHPAGNRGPLLRGKPDEATAEDSFLERYYVKVLRATGTLWQEVPVVGRGARRPLLARARRRPRVVAGRRSDRPHCDRG